MLLVLEVSLCRLLFPAEPLAGHLLRDFTARFSRLPQKGVACRLINFEHFIVFTAGFRGLNLFDQHLVRSLLHLEPHLQLCVLIYNFLNIKVQLMHLLVFQMQLFARLSKLHHQILHQHIHGRASCFLVVFRRLWQILG